MVHPAQDGEEMYVDVGVYGVPNPPKGSKYHAVDTQRDIEDFVAKVDG